MITEKPTGPWIRMHSGRSFPLESPEYEDFDLGEIAHNLSRINRYTGAIVPEQYSVAEHSVRVAFYLRGLVKMLRPNAPPMHLQEAFRAGLMHDAAEAYLNDLSSPLKRLPALDGYRALHEKYERRIEMRFNITRDPEINSLISEADLAVFDVEHPILQPGDGHRAERLAILVRPPNDGYAGEFMCILNHWGLRPNVAKDLFLKCAVAHAGLTG